MIKTNYFKACLCIMQFKQNILGKSVIKMKTKDKDNDDVVLESDKAI